MICFRFDVDTRRGLVVQTPPLLDLLAEHQIRATFFVVMGREANLAEIVRLRLLAPSDSKSKLNVEAKGGPAAILAAALLPRRVGSGNRDLLVRIVAEGHQLAPHGWSHIQWQRNLAAIDPDRHISRARRAQSDALGVEALPLGWASPGRSIDEDALDAMDRAEVQWAGDLPGTAPFMPSGRRTLQLPVTRFETIAQMRGRGLSDPEIVDTYLADIDAQPEWCCIYEHPDDLGPAELAIFGGVFHGVRARGLEPATHAEAAAAWSGE